MSETKNDIKARYRRGKPRKRAASFEKRAHRRFAGKGGTFAAFPTSDAHSLSHLGEVLDFSEGGLSLLYVSMGDRISAPAGIDLFAYTDRRLHIRGIPCRVVYELVVEPLDGGAARKRCGIRFGRLSRTQSSRLKSFMESYAESAA